MRRMFVAVTAAVSLLLPGAAAYADTTIAGPQAAGPPGEEPVDGRGAAGIGDPYYPGYGNGGYDVRHYDVRLRYYPATDRLTGTTTILARARQDLTTFNLDFLLDVTSVRVNGRAASFTREGVQELVVTPARPVADGQPMTIVVQYAGVPSAASAHGFTAWKRTADGAMAIGEPEIAAWWFPSNDHPLDKATFDISVAVPDGVEVISNGVMPRPPVRELIGWTRWSWRSTQPMATYLAFVVIGQYDIVTDTAANGQQVINAYSQRLPADFGAAARASIERTPEVVEWASAIFGPYPFEAQGGVAGPPDGVSFALENQTRPVYGPNFFRRGSNMSVVVHELAHQWFGDSVAVARWQDIWLNEGFASYAEWLWSEAQGEGTAQELFDFTYVSNPAEGDFWKVLPGDPGPERQFDPAVYDRGAMTVHQLRRAVGDDAFFTIVRRWTAEHRHGNATTQQFIALAEEVSGQELDPLFTTWLFTAGRPELDASAASARRSAPRQPASWNTIRQTRELLQH